MQLNNSRIQKILLITGNSGKENEFRNLLGLENISLSSCDLPIHEIQSLDINEIGRQKTITALSYQHECKGYDAVLTDDTALSLSCLKGLPGPLIKWFLKTLTAQGIAELVEGKEQSATATCLLTLGIVENQELIQFVGKTEGRIVSSKGKKGFGWDSIFQPLRSNITYGELDILEKNKISHRAKAISKLKDWLTAKKS